MTKCGECGYENTDGLDYCDGCGAKLEAGAGAASSAPAAPAGGGSADAKPADESASATSSEAPTSEIKAEAPAEAPAVVAAFKAKLKIVRGGRKDQEFSLEEGNNLVGRWDPETGAFPEVDLEQDDTEAKISRKHALVRIENGKITVEDIGSLNGTYVNRQPRLQPGSPVELKAGDEIIIGKTF
ncbi:MAG: FHA domain-containing protein, partial [Burkholderiales bacterium]